MRKKKSTSQQPSHPVTSGTPSFDSFHDGVFADATQARSVLAAIGKFLRAGSPPAPREDEQPFHGFAIESTRVEYRVGIQRIRMQTRFASGSVVLVVPAAKGEPEGALENRETRILAEFATTVYEAQIRSSFQFWRALDKNAQEKLLRDFGS